MNNSMTLLVGLLMVQASAYTQPAQYLHPHTRGNQIDLTLVNESETTPIEHLEVRVVRHPQAVSFTDPIQTVESVEPGGTHTARFTFDVGQPSSANDDGVDTIQFLVSDESGNLGEKVISVMFALPTTYALQQNFPNPFNPTTTIYYQLPVESKVSVRVYNSLGQEVASLFDGIQPAGYHDVRFEGASFPSGVYFYRFRAASLKNPSESFMAIKKMVLVK